MPDVVLRGEVLINKSTFAKKYSNFVNPRSFVSGVLNNKIENLSADEIMICQLLFMILEL